MVDLNLEELELGRSFLEFDTELVRADPDDETRQIRAKIRGELQVEDMDQRIVVHGKFAAQHTVHCDRCAKGFALETEPDLEVMILRNPTRGDDPEDADDAWVIQQQSGVVDLDESLMEAVLLEAPQKALCREDCRGLCPACGIDRNEHECECSFEELDPRWAALGKLKLEDSEEDSPRQE